ncbi:MAG: glucuronate isomerase [Cyclobacteriaceae bacterium]|nr:glucuronate isomerase [Cyclobacteriaceae bacterium]
MEIKSAELARYSEDFLLQSQMGKRLFYEVAKDLPIIDYHNHLCPQDLATNRQFKNLAEAWVLHDPYKHRAMRICGVPEQQITGDASDESKFMHWAKTLPKTIGNPLHLWSAMELKEVFDLDESLNEHNAREIWDRCNELLQQPGYGAMDMLRQFKVEKLCTSDVLLDDLEAHQKASKFHGISVLPSLRGDAILAVDTPDFDNWLQKLQHATQVVITSLDHYKHAISVKLNDFDSAGCCLADHSLDAGFVFLPTTAASAQAIFKKLVQKDQVSVQELSVIKNHLLEFLGKEYARRNWVLQLHIGAQRFTSSRLRKLAGPAGGYAGMGFACDIRGLAQLIDRMELEGLLPKTILFTLNPVDNEAFATLTGSYAQDGIVAKIQFGPAWWYNDQYHGIIKHLQDIASFGLLSQFIGMTTDSRSVFSFSRHEYFRRILCDQIGTWVAQGVMPADESLLAQLVKDIAYFNSKQWIFNE